MAELQVIYTMAACCAYFQMPSVSPNAFQDFLVTESMLAQLMLSDKSLMHKPTLVQVLNMCMFVCVHASVPVASVQLTMQS